MISLKDFTKWAAIDYKRKIEEKWSGARGQFKIAAKVDLSRENFRIRDGVFSLDDARGTLGFSLRTGKQSAVSVQLVSDVIDIDRYAPEGLLSKKSKTDLPGFLIETLTALVGERDIDLSAKTKKLVMNLVEARDVAIEFNANENSVEFRQFKLGSVGDASVDLSGLVKFSDNHVTGSIDGTVTADDPAKLVKLISAIEPSAIWLSSVSPLKLKINGQAVAREKQTSGKLRVTGLAGKTTISGNGEFEGTVADWQKARLHLSGKMFGKSAKGLLAVFGTIVEQGDDGAGKVAITATGNLTDGLATSADFEGFGVTGQFSGTVESRGSVPGAQGRLAVLIENTDQLFSILGLPGSDASPIGKVFSGEGVVSVSPQRFNLKEIRGTVAGTSFKGELDLAYGKEIPVLSLNLQSGRLSLPFVLSSSMLGRDGNRQTAATRFSREAMAGINAAIKVKSDRLDFWPGFETRNGSFFLAVDSGAIKVTANGERVSGQPINLEIDAKIGVQLTRVSGKISGAVKLGDVLQTNQDGAVLDGVATIDGEFGGSGRTPGGLLAALSGKGTYQIADGVIRNISPTQFAKNLPQAETAKDVEVMIANSLRTGDMKFGNGKGQIELENGIARFVPLEVKGAGAQGSLRMIYELPTGLADISVRLKLAEPANVPGFEVAYAGPPDALAPSSDFTALKSYLTVAALNRTLDKLEALEEEQRRLVEEEKQARAEAETKRKAQQEKQRLLREKQRKLLEDATRKKVEEISKAREKKAPREKPQETPQETPQPAMEDLPTVVISPAPEPLPRDVPVQAVAPTTKATVTPQVQIDELPPLIPDQANPAPIPLRKKPIRPVKNWRNGEIEGGR